MMSSCAVRQISHLPPSPPPGTLLSATVSDLVQDVNDWSAKIDTLQAVVQFQATALLQQAGLEKQYHEIRGYILLKKPAQIRIQGEAPVVGTEIFDMVSDGRQFRLSIPPKNRFIEGQDDYRGPEPGGFENLRPQHILEALLIAPINPNAQYFVEQVERHARLYYVLTVVEPEGPGRLRLRRRIWFDRTDLRVSRVEIFGARGKLEEDARYSGYGDFQGVSYPSQIVLSRPEEGYILIIQFQKVDFNAEIAPEKFILPRPRHAKLVRLGEAKVGSASDR